MTVTLFPDPIARARPRHDGGSVARTRQRVRT